MKCSSATAEGYTTSESAAACNLDNRDDLAATGFDLGFTVVVAALLATLGLGLRRLYSRSSE